MLGPTTYAFLQPLNGVVMRSKNYEPNAETTARIEGYVTQLHINIFVNDTLVKLKPKWYHENRIM